MPLLYRLTLLVSACLWTAEARPPSSSSLSPETSSHNAGNKPPYSPTLHANHLFNAIHSSMRQWGSSLNHNGMTIFPATVPKDTVVYHGNPGKDVVTGMEWVSFERNHALQFARLYLETWPAPVVLPPGWNVRGGKKADQKAGQEAETWDDQSAADTQKILQAKSKKQKRQDHPTFFPFPGYLHTYKAKRDLHLLYLDGSAAAKCARGTLDLSDTLLLNNRTFEVERDHPRARQLCDLAAKKWHGRIDGFLRMEAGFEIILCAFQDSLELVEVQQTQSVDHGGTKPDPRDYFQWVKAAAILYDGVGGTPKRVLLNYERFVTGFGYDFDLFYDDSPMPRLAGASDEILDDMRRELDEIIADPASFEQVPPKLPDRQDLVSLIVQKYAYSLQYLVTAPALAESSLKLAEEIHFILRPFIDTKNRDAVMETERCALEFFPGGVARSSQLSSAQNASVAAQAIYTVSDKICSTLFTTLYSLPLHWNTTQDSRPTEQILALKNLASYLSWTEWKKCKGCDWGEICSIPMFPLGTEEEHERPRCTSAETFELTTDYWL